MPSFKQPWTDDPFALAPTKPVADNTFADGLLDCQRSTQESSTTEAQTLPLDSILHHSTPRHSRKQPTDYSQRNSDPRPLSLKLGLTLTPSPPTSSNKRRAFPLHAIITPSPSSRRSFFRKYKRKYRRSLGAAPPPPVPALPKGVRSIGKGIGYTPSRKRPSAMYLPNASLKLRTHRGFSLRALFFGRRRSRKQKATQLSFARMGPTDGVEDEAEAEMEAIWKEIFGSRHDMTRSPSPSPAPAPASKHTLEPMRPLRFKRDTFFPSAVDGTLHPESSVRLVTSPSMPRIAEEGYLGV